jgi:hypothetical protein
MHVIYLTQATCKELYRRMLLNLNTGNKGKSFLIVSAIPLPVIKVTIYTPEISVCCLEQVNCIKKLTYC